MEKTKKQEIIAACLREFSEHGYDKASTNSICEAAGVSKGLLFHYFGSKKKIFLFLVEECTRNLIDFMEGTVSDEMDFFEIITAYTQKKLQFFCENPFFYRLLMQAFYSPPKDLQQELAEKYKQLSSIGYGKMAEIVGKLPLKDGVSSEDALTVIFSVTQSIEKKYNAAISAAQKADTDIFENIKTDFSRLLTLVLYGICR